MTNVTMTNSEKMQWLIDNHKEIMDEAISISVGMTDSVQMDAESYWKYFSSHDSTLGENDSDYVYHEKYINRIRFFCLTERWR